ncbi:MAG TPA: VWA domain-containing protein [Candidatus Limnocylindrales bacterium]|nr:VWA domain-containing protein [Candidatus Limnocylindrales bacterium]
MSFAWPFALALLLLVPLGAAAYVALGRRRRAGVEAAGGLGRAIATDGSSRRGRGVGPAFVLGGLAIVVLALARPQAVLSVPRLEGTVVLAFDVSRSMAATDFSPSRIEAAKAAARSFVEHAPPTVQIGVVAFSDSGVSVQVPTSDSAAVAAAIDRLTPQRGTSVAGGIEASLAAIATAENPTAGYYSNRSPGPSPSPVPPGSHASALVVLLTDGENNERPDPLGAARDAANRGIRIDAVGLGTAEGTNLQIDGFTVFTRLDETALRSIADTTAGTYYDATDAAALTGVYDQVANALVVKPETTEVTAPVAGVGLAALVIGGLVSLVRLGRIP